jgi:hypothetical protein
MDLTTKYVACERANDMTILQGWTGSPASRP